MEKNGVIYAYVNNVNAHAYIGQTFVEYERQIQHRKIMDRLIKGNPSKDTYPVHYAMAKYGYDNFTYIKLFDGITTQEELDKLEIESILKYDTMVPNGYNLKKGGYAGGKLGVEGVKNFGKHRKKKIRCIELDKVFESAKEALYYLGKTSGSLSNIWYKDSSIWFSREYHWQWFVDGCKIYNKEDCDKWDVDRILQRSNQMSIKRSKKVICIETGKIYRSVEEAAKFIGGTATNISCVCRGKMDTYYGYHWKYYSENMAVPLLEDLQKKEVRYNPIICLETRKVYRNSRVLAKELVSIINKKEINISSSVLKCCEGLINTCFGLHWKFYDENTTYPDVSLLPKPPEKKVICIETEKEYDSINNCAKDMDLFSTNIVRCCKGKAMSVKGYHFKYKDNN